MYSYIRNVYIRSLKKKESGALWAAKLFILLLNVIYIYAYDYAYYNYVYDLENIESIKNLSNGT